MIFQQNYSGIRVLRSRVNVILITVVCLLVISGCLPETSQVRTPGNNENGKATEVGENTFQTTPTQVTSTDIPPTPTQILLTPTLPPTLSTEGFDGESAYQDILYQVELGPRTPGSEGHQRIREWIAAELEEAGWSVEVQETTYMNQPVYNITAIRELVEDEDKPWILPMQIRILTLQNARNRCPGGMMVRLVWQSCWNWPGLCLLSSMQTSHSFFSMRKIMVVSRSGTGCMGQGLTPNH
jgi:hypothetical protein